MACYTTTIVQIAGPPDDLEAIHSVISRQNEQVDTFVLYCHENSAFKIMQELHLNVKRLRNLGCWWTDAKMTKRGLLVFKEHCYGKSEHPADLLKQKYANLAITYTFVSYY